MNQWTKTATVGLVLGACATRSLSFAIEFERTLDAKAALAEAAAKAAADAGLATPRARPVVLPVDEAAGDKPPMVVADGDGYALRGSEIMRVRDKYDGKIFGNRLGVLEGSRDVVAIAAYRNKLLALQKNGRLWVHGDLSGLKGVWTLLAVGLEKMALEDSKLFVTERGGRRLLYTGDIEADSYSAWGVPLAVIGNGLANFREVKAP